MILKPQDISPIPGSLSSLVKSLTMKGVKGEALERAVKRKFSKSRRKGWEELADYWRLTKTAATNLKKSGPKRAITEVVKARRSSVTSVFRVTLNFQFYNPDLEEDQNIGLDVDISTDLNKGDAYKEITKRVVDWLIQFYGLKTATQFYKSDFAKLIDIKAIEGV